MLDPIPSTCPYCGEPVDLMIDSSVDAGQQYVEDCPVCCRPWNVSVFPALDGSWSAELRTQDE